MATTKKATPKKAVTKKPVAKKMAAKKTVAKKVLAVKATAKKNVKNIKTPKEAIPSLNDMKALPESSGGGRGEKDTSSSGQKRYIPPK